MACFASRPVVMLLKVGRYFLIITVRRSHLFGQTGPIRGNSGNASCLEQIVHKTLLSAL